MRRNSRRLATRVSTSLAIGVVGLASLTACGGSSGGDSGKVTLASYSRGFSVVLTEQLSEDRGSQAAFKVKNYSDLQQLYTDLLSGNADMTIGGSDVFASQAAKGAPIHIAATISPNSTAVVGMKKITSASDLKGKRVAAITSSGGWHLAAAVIKRDFGLTASKDYQLINVPSMASGAAQVNAGTADYVVGWEPSVQAALEQNKKLVVSLSIADASDGETFGSGWQLVLAVRNSVKKSTEDKVVAGLVKAASELNSSPAQADALAVKFGFKPGTAESVMGQKIPPFVVKPITAEVKTELKEQLSLVQSQGGESKNPPAGFYGKK